MEKEIGDNQEMGNIKPNALTSFLAGIVITGIGAFLGYPHDMPTKADIANLQQTIQQEINQQNERMDRIELKVDSSEVDIGALKAASHR